MFTRVKGTQDLLDLTLFNGIVDSAKKHLILYNFSEIATPILEYTELFTRSLGTHTDVVHKQMFTIETKDDERICLRPEATASTVRAFVEAGITRIPWNVFSYGPMFRYERPQKGRYRQFNQINIESIGAISAMHDVHIITMIDRFFHEKLLLQNYALLVNFLGCQDDRAAYKDILAQFLTDDMPLCQTCIYRKSSNIMRVFDCKEDSCQKIYQNAPVITDHICTNCAQEWSEVQQGLMLLSVSYSHKPTLVRGLDYYNKTVFEFESKNLGAQGAFCAGGRYNQLVGQIGDGKDLPSIGAAIGIERVILLLESAKNTSLVPSLPALYSIVPMDKPQVVVALLLADQLRTHNFCVEVLLDHEPIKNMMKKVHKNGALYAIIIGQDEQDKNEVMLKNMVTGNQESVAQNQLVNRLKKA
jgi:histidyl-tRNA synthetase